MCGICGSSSLETAFELYMENLKRGGFAHGFMAVGRENLVLKQREAFTYKQLEKEIGRRDVEYYLFHTRAPTNSIEMEFQPETTHPFNTGNIWVAHNGIISNFKELRGANELKVDSQIIAQDLAEPTIIYDEYFPIRVANTYSKYKGLLSSWVVKRFLTGSDIHLVKAGSSLFTDQPQEQDAFHRTDSFTSTRTDKFNVPLKDGYIYEIQSGIGIVKVNTFNYETPYFIP